MAEFDHGIKLITDTSARELARVAGVACGRLTPLEGTLPATIELVADRAFRASRGRERFIVYFEFYTRWDPHAPWDLLAKSGLLSQRLRLPTVCLVFVLLPRGFRSPGGQWRLEAAGAPTQQLWFREVCLWELEPEDWWEQVPGLMALYPLCRHGQTPPDAVRHAAEVIERGTTDAPQRADDLALLNIFGELAFPRLDVGGIIGRDKMKGSKLIRSFVAEARREDVAEALRIRLGEEAVSAVLPLLERIEDAERLRGLHALAIRCASLDEFRAGLAASSSPRRRARPGRQRRGAEGQP
jgi:hypothetical protein